MAEEGPYEIMPYKEVVELRKQIEELKAKSSGTGSNQLIESINRLTQQMNSMMGLFKTAAEEMRLEEKDEHFVAKKIEPLIDKLDAIIDQNQTIAEGMVAVADIIKENFGKRKEAPRPFLRPEPEFASEFEPMQPEIPKFPEMEQRKEPMPRPMPRHTPPRPMPNIPMPSSIPGQMPQAPAFEEPFTFEEPKRKKGLFGRLKR